MSAQRLLRLVRGVARNVCGCVGRVVRVLALHERAELVVIELRLGQPRALLEHDDRKPGRRQLFREDAAGGAGTDDDEVDGVAGRET